MFLEAVEYNNVLTITKTMYNSLCKVQNILRIQSRYQYHIGRIFLGGLLVTKFST